MGALVGCEWLSLQGQLHFASPKLLEVQQGVAQSDSSGAKRIKSHEDTSKATRRHEGACFYPWGATHPTA